MTFSTYYTGERTEKFQLAFPQKPTLILLHWQELKKCVCDCFFLGQIAHVCAAFWQYLDYIGTQSCKGVWVIMQIITLDWCYGRHLERRLGNSIQDDQSILIILIPCNLCLQGTPRDLVLYTFWCIFYLSYVYFFVFSKVYL